MIPVEAATKIVLEQLGDWGEVHIPLSKAVGRVSAEAIHADRDFPPFTRVSMDGIAIAFEQFDAGLRRFPVQGIQTAGSPAQTLQDPTHCLEVMTGSVLPVGTDTVIRYEDVQIEEGNALITIEDIRQGQNAHTQGLDRSAGSLIVPAGLVLSGAEAGVAATVGMAEILVKKNPTILLISTGDELVEINQQPLPHQIRKSNVYALEAALAKQGLAADRLHLSDDRDAIYTALEDALDRYDVLIMSGGVSKGKKDYIPEVLEELQVEKLFHRVQQRPGKPFWFGHRNQTKVFALPGNPVSTFMCLHRYFFPWWKASMGQTPMAPFQARLTEDYTFNPNLTYYLQVKIQQDSEGRLLAYPVTGKGSGDLANLVDADGFLELPSGQDLYPAGSLYPLWTYR